MNKSGKNNCDGKLSRKKWHTHMSMQATLGSIGKRRHFKGWIDDVGHLKIEIEESTKYAIGLKKERITIITITMIILRIIIGIIIREDQD